MRKKIIIAIGAVAVIVSLMMPITEKKIVPTNSNSILKTDVVTFVNDTATWNRTIALLIGTIAIAYIVPEKKKQE